MYRFFKARRNTLLTRTAKNSARTMDTQIPSLPINNGRIKTAATWNTSVRRNDMIADTGPLFRAVKKDEVQIPKPENRKENEYTKKALNVKSNKPASNNP